MAIVLCASCDEALTGELRWGDESSIDRGASMEEPTVPEGLLVRDPKPVFIVFEDPTRADTRWIQKEITPAGTLVVNPVDVLPDALTYSGFGCCGLDGWRPNTSCICGAMVATTKTDCYTVAEVRFHPAAAKADDA